MERENNVLAFLQSRLWNDFAYAHWEEFIRLHPRLEALETPIEVQVETRTDWRGNPYKQKVIQAIDNG